MKFITSIIITALLSYAACLFFPWWSIAIAAFVVSAVIHQKPLKAFVCGFLALFLLWGIQSYYIDVQNGHLLATKVAGILPLGNSPVALILLTAFIGGLVAGMAALTGSFLRRSL